MDFAVRKMDRESIIRGEKTTFLKQLSLKTPYIIGKKVSVVVNPISEDRDCFAIAVISDIHQIHVNSCKNEIHEDGKALNTIEQTRFVISQGYNSRISFFRHFLSQYGCEYKGALITLKVLGLV